MVELNPKCRDARRKAIIDTASDIFLKEGFAAASMSSIAASVGGSKGTLYNYFSSKETLFAAVIQDHCDRGQAEVWDFDVEGGEVVAVLRALSERYLRLMLSDNVVALNRLVIAEAVRFPEIGRTLYEAGMRRGLKRLSGYITTAMEQGLLGRGDPALAAEQLTELCLSGAYRLRLLNVSAQPEPSEIATQVDTALATFLRLYGTGKPSGIAA